MNMRNFLFAALAVFFVSASVYAEIGGLRARADLKSPTGQAIGWVDLQQTPKGTYIHARFQNLVPGTHAFHVHETGDCTPPDFKSAGGHFNPDGHQHGQLSAGGPHRGDLPNINVAQDGRAEVQFFSPNLSLNEALFDNDGAALVIHAAADDYVSQPSGNAGERAACGIISKD